MTSPDEIHNEDSHYTHLAIGFLYTKDDNRIPIPLHDPELKACFLIDTDIRQNQTYGKNIKSRMLGRQKKTSTRKARQ